MREGQHETTPHSMHLRVRDVTFVRARSRCEVDGPPEAPAGGPEIDCLVGSTPPLPPPPPFPACSICQEEADDHTVVVACGHSFCRGCIEEWVARSSTCPNCRKPCERLRFSDGSVSDVVRCQHPPHAYTSTRERAAHTTDPPEMHMLPLSPPSMT